MGAIGGGLTTTGFEGGNRLTGDGTGGRIEIFLTVGTITGFRLLAIVTGLTLLGTTIALRKLFKVRFKATFKLFDLGLNGPDALDKLLGKLRGTITVKDALFSLGERIGARNRGIWLSPLRGQGCG